MPLKIHFLNVGHGDCTIVEHPGGHISVIDINNGTELDPQSLIEIGSLYGLGSTLMTMANRTLLEAKGYDVNLTNPIEYLVQNFPRRKIMRYIQTHPDMDHMRGISTLVSSGYLPLNFWDTKHDKEPEIQQQDVDDWETYLDLRNGHFQKTTVLRMTSGATGKFYNCNGDGTPGGDNIEILSPSTEVQKWANDNQDWNEISYVLRISHAGRSVILGGDAEEIAWKDLYERYGDNLSCQILKASHHGRNSGYYQPAVKAMSPAITIVSVGKKPTTDASNLYRKYSENVWSTRWKGNIIMTIPDDPNQPMLYDWQYDR